MPGVHKVKIKHNEDLVSSSNRLPVDAELTINNDPIDTDNPLLVEIPPCICAENSSSATLDAGATFTGQAANTNGYGIIYLSAYSDVASAEDGLVIEQSKFNR